MQAKLEGIFTNSCEIILEHNLAIGGYTYLVIFGNHINGGFIAIPNWGWCTECGAMQGSVGYNTEKLIKCGCPKDVAETIANYIELYVYGA